MLQVGDGFHFVIADVNQHDRRMMFFMQEIKVVRVLRPVREAHLQVVVDSSELILCSGSEQPKLISVLPSPEYKSLQLCCYCSACKPLLFCANKVRGVVRVSGSLVLDKSWVRAKRSSHLDAQGMVEVIYVLRRNNLIWSRSLFHPLFKSR